VTLELHILDGQCHPEPRCLPRRTYVTRWQHRRSEGVHRSFAANNAAQDDTGRGLHRFPKRLQLWDEVDPQAPVFVARKWSAQHSGAIGVRCRAPKMNSLK